MYAYWQLQDRERTLLRQAKIVLMNYIQVNGQTERERLEALAGAAKYVGFKSVEVLEKNGVPKFWFDSKKDAKFQEMREEIRNIHRGKFEEESVQIANILKKYRLVNDPWWKRIRFW